MPLLDKLKAELFKRRPTLAEIYTASGRQTLTEYAANWKVPSLPAQTSVPATPPTDKWLKILEQTISEIYPETQAREVMRQLSIEPLVSTVDHLGILNHPFFLNSNLIFSLRGNQKYLVTLATAGVSLNNSSWPGCLLLTSPDGKLRRFSFFADRYKTHPVLSRPAFTVPEAKRALWLLQKSNFLTPDQRKPLTASLEEIFFDPAIYNFGDFSRQASRLSARLWAKVFPSAPKLICLSLEKFVSKVLIEDVATDSRQFLHRLLFTPEGWDLAAKYFPGSHGAAPVGNKGSFLFWGVDKKGHRLHLRRQGFGLTDGNGFHLAMSPENLSSALEQGRLYPTSLVCFLLLLRLGLTALGGFNQVSWLNETKRELVALFREMGDTVAADRLELLPVDGFAESTLAFGLLPSKEIYKTTGTDLLKVAEDKYQSFRDLASRLTLADSIESELPEMYKVVVPDEQRDLELASVTLEQLAQETGLKAKLASA